MDYQDQLTLLSDILKNQQAENYGTEDEWDQIQRLTDSLQQQGQLDEKMQQTIANISDYCVSRSYNNNSEQINQWIHFIDEETRAQELYPD